MPAEKDRNDRDVRPGGRQGLTRRWFLAGLGVSGGLGGIGALVPGAAAGASVLRAAAPAAEQAPRVAPAGPAPTVLTRQFRSARPGEVFSLAANGLTSETQVRLWVAGSPGTAGAPPADPPADAIPLTVVSLADDALTAVVPATVPYGWYAIYASNDGETWSAPQVLNEPDAWYLQSSVNAPGEVTAVFGTDLALAPGHHATVALAGAGDVRVTACEVVKATAQAVWFRIPGPARPGTYRLLLGNGQPGGALSETGLSVSVRAPVPVPGRVYHVVTEFGDDPTGTADSTAALQQALDAAAGRPGGAIVQFPAGTYLISAKLILGAAAGPVTLKGAGGQRTTILMSASAPYSEPEVVPGFYDIYGSSESDPYGMLYLAPGDSPVSIEDLGFDCNANRIIAIELNGRNNVDITKVTVNAAAVHEGSQLARGYFAVLANNNKELTIQDCSFAAANGLFGTNEVDIRVLATTMTLAYSGSTQALDAGVQIWGGKRITIAGNTFDRDATIGYYAKPVTFGAARTSELTYGVADTVFIEDVYVGHNSMSNGGGPNQNDGELIVGDTDSGDITGGGEILAVSAATASTLTVATSTFEATTGSAANPVGAYVFIVGGTGTGQVRKVIANTAETLGLEGDWDVIPDSTSRFIVQVTYRHNAYVDNVATQAQKYIGIYCSAFMNVISGNNIDGADAITPGQGSGTTLFALINVPAGVEPAGHYPVFFNHVTDNTVNEGSNAMNAVSYNSALPVPEYPIARCNLWARNTTTNAYDSTAGAAGVALTATTAAGQTSSQAWGAGNTVALDVSGTGTTIGAYIGEGYEGTVVQKTNPIVNNGTGTIATG